MSGRAWILAFDASTPRCAIAVGWVDTDAGDHRLVVADDPDQGGQTASSQLMERIGRALGRAGIEAAELAAVACGRGPGTFTGTRVAVASAKGLAYGVNRPVLGLSTLAAVAASAEHDGAVLSLLDARRQEVYGGQWRVRGHAGGMPSLRALGDEQVLPPAALVESLRPWPPDLRVVGSGVDAHRDALPEAWLATARPLPGPTALGLWLTAAAAWTEGRTIHPAALEAVYLRASYAEMGLNPPKRPFVKSPFV